MSRSCTHVFGYTAKYEYVKFYGISQRKNRFNDVSEIYKHKNCILGIKNFAATVLSYGHSRKKHKSNKGIHKKSVKAKSRK